MNVSRRHFLAGTAGVTAGFLGLRRWLRSEEPAESVLYGTLVPEPLGLLNLPAGFSCRAFSRTGETMDDGFLVPGAHDGMGAFPGPGGTTILVRNHELLPAGPADGPFGRRNELWKNADPSRVYDPGSGRAPGRGGTTTLLYDTREGKLLRHWLSLAGTWRNCAGGATPWGSWISCEEVVRRAGGPAERDHGYSFEVPATPEMGLVEPVPLRAMGRFNHEAAAVDPASGAVYQTEDRADGLFYRFLPREPGRLARGGRLQALRIKDRPGFTAANRSASAANRIPVGRPMDVEWIDLPEPEPPRDELRDQGHARGATAFTRGEGLWTGRDGIYFTCTDGGLQRKGQVWKYVPSPDEGKPGERGRLELFLEPDDADLLENCDNLTFAPWGDLILCEDGPGRQFVVGVTPSGRIYTIAQNAFNSSEFAGATFSPDGSTLFVNLQDPGVTLALTGPWKR